MSINELSAMLGYPQTPPPIQSSNVVTHLIGFEGQPRYEASVKVVREIREKMKIEGLTPAQKKIKKVLDRRKTPISAREMSGLTGLSKCFCNTIMAAMYKDGLLTRCKERVALTKQYVYAVRTQAVR